jgi:hypothetical protein
MNTLSSREINLIKGLEPLLEGECLPDLREALGRELYSRLFFNGDLERWEISRSLINAR